MAPCQNPCCNLLRKPPMRRRSAPGHCAVRRPIAPMRPDMRPRARKAMVTKTTPEHKVHMRRLCARICARELPKLPAGVSSSCRSPSYRVKPMRPDMRRIYIYMAFLLYFCIILNLCAQICAAYIYVVSATRPGRLTKSAIT